MISIIDYGVGNLYSLRCSFEYIGQQVIVTDDPSVIAKSDRVVLPGVGAFADAAAKLSATGLDKVVKAEAASGKPLLGVCLGMQMLLEKSFEYGEHQGLGLIKGEVVPIAPKVSKDYKIPHIGWNALSFPAEREKCQIFKYLDDGAHVYFVHSFYADGCGDALAATTEYGATLTAAVASGNVFGTQFHPEKSGEVGLDILRAFCEV